MAARLAEPNAWISQRAATEGRPYNVSLPPQVFQHAPLQLPNTAQLAFQLDLGLVTICPRVIKFKPRLAGGVILGIAIGLAIGVGAYTFVYARGYSYMTDNAEACVNCHVMQDQFSGWLKSSHRSVAACNDCHTPPGLVAKYATKARNGFWHSYYFTTGWFDDNIHISPRGREVTEEACRKCHQEIVQAIEGPHPEAKDARTSCIRCHDSVGHLH